MSGWPMAALTFETTAAKGSAETTVARSTSTRRMAMRSIVLTLHLTESLARATFGVLQLASTIGTLTTCWATNQT